MKTGLRDFGTDTAFRGATFEGLEANGKVYDGLEFDSCHFLSCDMTGAAFKRCHFIDCRFDDCNFTTARLTASRLRSVSFQKCRLGGINWSAVSSLDDLSFNHCVLDSGMFANLKLPRFSAVDCRIREADFAECDLRGAVFTKSDLMGARFFGADLSNADLRGAFDYFIDARQTKMKKARVSLPEAVALLAGLDILLEDQP